MRGFVIVLLLCSAVVGALGVTAELMTRGSWLYATLTLVVHGAIVAQWWLCQHESATAATTADRMLVLAAVALMIAWSSALP